MKNNFSNWKLIYILPFLTITLPIMLVVYVVSLLFLMFVFTILEDRGLVKFYKDKLSYLFNWSLRF